MGKERRAGNLYFLPAQMVKSERTNKKGGRRAGLGIDY